MTYSIKEVAERFGVTAYTIRYYDKQGLLPFVSKNSNGYREFTDSDLGLMHTIMCLKQTNMPIKDIRTYIDYCMTGSETIEDRKDLLQTQRKRVIDEMKRLSENLQEIDRKIKMYSAPNAKETIDLQRKLSGMEKEYYQLDNPYEVR